MARLQPAVVCSLGILVLQAFEFVCDFGFRGPDLAADTVPAQVATLQFKNRTGGAGWR